ncbi:MAG: outer membrane protein assembly factor BamB family protein [Gemmatimonadota bacterium]
MPRNPPSLVYVGIKGQVVAFNRSTGAEAWRVKLKRSISGSYVLLYRDTQYLYATTSGEIWCLEPATGSVLWHDPMRGLGTDIASVTSDSPLGPTAALPEPAMVTAMRRRSSST